jgi:hypothetical protein
MRLILAIEPDRRQASKVAALVKNKLHAEIVSGDTTEHAVKALAGRVPDLILTSLLLSRKDEAALADWLRESDEAGAHVQTLVIPVLGGGYDDYREEGSGLLSRLRGRSSDATTDGCDPEIFAEQIREYLERAAEERRHAALLLEDMEEAAAAAAAVGEAAPVAFDEPAAGKPIPAYEDVPYVQTASWTPSADAADNPEPAYFEVEAVVPMDAAPVGTESLSESETSDDGDAWSEIALGGEDTDQAAGNSERPTYSLEEDDAASLELTSEPIDLQRFVDELTSQAAIEAPQRPRAHGDDVLDEFEEALEVINTDDPEPNRPNSSSEADSEVLTPLVGATAWPHLDSTVAEVPPGADAAATEEAARPRSRKKGRGASPQEEWNLFDPEQCGFSALLAKLDQMTD